MNGLELADLVKRRTIIAIAADDMLMQRLVFKGGNALVYAHGITVRGSFDIDFSMEGEFNDIEELRTALQRALRSSFEEVSLIPSTSMCRSSLRTSPRTCRRSGVDTLWTSN